MKRSIIDIWEDLEFHALSQKDEKARLLARELHGAIDDIYDRLTLSYKQQSEAWQMVSELTKTQKPCKSFWAKLCGL